MTNMQWAGGSNIAIPFPADFSKAPILAVGSL